MRRLRAAPLPSLLLLSLLGPATGCSNGSNPGPPGTLPPASQPPPTKFEAGANCASVDDCEPGLVCLFPASTCNVLPVCVAAPPANCDHPEIACSCLGEAIHVCDGYATNPVDSTAKCDGGVILPVDGGTDASVPADGGRDAPGAGDGASGADAADAAGD